MTTQGKSLREKIIAYPDVKEKVITVKEWGDEKILIKGITVKNRYNIFTDENDNNKRRMDLKLITALTVIECSYDPKTKEKIFTKEDAEILMDKNADAMEYIAGEIGDISGMTVKAQEAIEKNSDSGTPQG